MSVSKAWRWHLLLFSLLVVVFGLLPQLDIWFSSLFYQPQQGFYLKDHIAVRLIYKGTEYMAVLVVLGVLLRLVAYYLIAGFSRRFNYKSWFLLCCILLGPGLVVNNIFKDHWDRARPRQIEQFDGAKKFTPAWYIADQCQRNCSFVSGHAAAGFTFMAFGLLASYRSRKKWWHFGLFMGFGIGVVRVIQGGHFLSDVIFCYFILWFLFQLLSFIFEKPYKKQPMQAQ